MTLKLYKTINLMIVDDHKVFCSSLSHILPTFPSVGRITTAYSGEDAIKKIKEDPEIQVVLMDLKMPGIGGIHAIHKILTYNKDIRIIAMTAYGDDPLPSTLFSMGIKGYFTKQSDLDVVAEAICKVGYGGTYLEPKIAQQIAQNKIGMSAKNIIETLSPKELDVMIKIASGLGAQEIADLLCISIKTFHTYRYRIYEKLKLTNDVQIALMAIRNRLFIE